MHAGRKHQVLRLFRKVVRLQLIDVLHRGAGRPAGDEIDVLDDLAGGDGDRARRVRVRRCSGGALEVPGTAGQERRAPQGPGHPEVYGSGLSLLRDVVLLPHARARLLLDDTARMAVLARRFAPARCVPLEAGTRIDVSADGAWPPGIRVLGEDGHLTAREAA